MLIIAVIGEIIGLVCMDFALYNVIKSSTKLESRWYRTSSKSRQLPLKRGITLLSCHL